MSETAEDTKEMSLGILDQRESSLTMLALSAKDLVITGPQDKEGYKRVREKRIELKNERVSVQTDAKDLRENAVKFQKTVIKREKQLIAIIAQEESRLSSIEDEYDRWQDEIRKAEERKENERIQARVSALAKFNYALDIYDAKVMEEENFQSLLGHAEADYLKDQERIAAEKAEAARLKKEEEAKIQAEREELARKRAEAEAMQKELERERAHVREQQEAIRKEQEAKEAAIRAEREALEKEKRKVEEEKRIEQARKEAAERAIIEEQERVKREAEAKAERERLAKIEAERQEALKPDKEKLFSYAQKLMQVEFPELSTEEAKRLTRTISEKVVTTSEFIHDLASKL